MKIAKVVTMDGSVIDVEYNFIEENYTTIKFYKTENKNNFDIILVGDENYVHKTRIF